MRKATLLVLTVLLLSGCTKENAPLKPADSPFVDRHMENVTQLTFEGDNGEAYFSPDDRKLIFQSSRGGYACDKIWVMNIDGSEKRRLSPDRGALRLNQSPSRGLSAETETVARGPLYMAAFPV
jgi:hypothetical protein